MRLLHWFSANKWFILAVVSITFVVYWMLIRPVQIREWCMDLYDLRIDDNKEAAYMNCVRNWGLSE